MSGTPLSRRQAALGLIAAALSGELTACSKPEEEILPYVEQPETVIPGVPQSFATALPLNGFARGVLVTSHEGRPTKVEGNPRHPGSLGATDVFAEAELLQLYDPDRSRIPRHGGRVATWHEAQAALLPRLAGDGDGVRLLTGPITSPTLLRLIGDIRRKLPKLGWHAHAPIDLTEAQRGAALAFGRPQELLPQMDRAAVVVCLDADPLGPGPDQLRLARGFAARRQARAGADAAHFQRLYAIEPTVSLTGANADHRLPVQPDELPALAAFLAAELGAPLPHPVLAEGRAAFLRAVAADLRAHPGAALVLAGPTLPPEAQALAHWINARLAAPLEAIAPVWPPEDGPAPLADLVRDMRAGAVQTLLILGCNPAYDAPGELGFAEALGHVSLSLHHGMHVDETAGRCTWHVPAPHPLEEWGDLRAMDGTAAIVQPLIRPLYATQPTVALLGLLLGSLDTYAYAAVRETWRAGRNPVAFEAWWRRALHDGVVPDSAAPRIALPAPRLPALPPAPPRSDLTLVLRPDASAWDGAYANNAWLQECPRPLTRQVWGNALLMAPEEAAKQRVQEGDRVRIEAAGTTVEAVVLPQPGIAPGVAALTLGYGRSRAGALGTRLGTDAYRLRRTDAPWLVPNVVLTRLGDRVPPVIAQRHQELEGEARELLPMPTLAEALHGHADDERPPSFYPDFAYPGPAWAMLIDTTLCIGCNACVVACQSENNIPVIGPEEIAWGRDMHWLRIDTYRQEAGTGFQPVPCMHCEQAPCEPVCPVAASVHDHEGLNLQVYNRCIGTRFCQSNCPYKVRRFNFFGYADGQEYKNQGAPVLAAQHNPEVTVRARGVMEKCTYCVQRISAARRTAEKESRAIGAGEVVTACQSACPTRAIRFGDLAQKESEPAQLRREPHHYALLGELGTRPRTTYLKRVRNPNPAIDGGSA